jgi:hypothetical protein
MEVSVMKMSRTQHDLKLPINQYTQGPTDGFHDFTLPLDAVSGLKSTGKFARIFKIYQNAVYVPKSSLFLPKYNMFTKFQRMT